MYKSIFLVSVGCLGTSVGVFVNFYRDKIEDVYSKYEYVPGFDHSNLFDRRQFVFFDPGVYACIAATVSGVMTTILAGVALGVERNEREDSDEHVLLEEIS